MTDSLQKMERIPSIDRSRGLVVLSMVFFQTARIFEYLPILRRVASHDTEDGLVIGGRMTLADFVAPFFFFLIALTFIPSLQRRIARDGARKAYTHFVMRYLGFLGFGTGLRAIDLVMKGRNWPLNYFYFAGFAVAVIGCLTALLMGVLKKEQLQKKTIVVVIWSLSVIGAVNLLEAVYNVYPMFITGAYPKNWDVFQSIGAAGLLMLIFAGLGTVARSIAAAILLGLFSLIHAMPNGMKIIDLETQGGAVGAVAWGAMLMVFSVMAELYNKDRAARQAGKKGPGSHSYIIANLVLTAIAVAVWVSGAVINKGSVSPGYVLVCLPVCAWTFWFIQLFDGWHPRLNILQWWGANAFLMYICQFFTVDVISTVVNNMESWPFWPAMAYLVGINGALTFLAYRLYKTNTVVKL